MKIGVVGASGYAGGEILRLLSRHSVFRPHYIAAGSNAGEKITSIHSHLSPYESQSFLETSVDKVNECDLVFLALPHGESASLIKSINANVKIVDLGADFRLQSEASWKKYYNDSFAGTWLYALPEIPGKRAEIAAASRVSNPGCYATAIALAAAPAAQAGAIDVNDIVVVAASGTTGAGRTSKINLSASEIMNSMTSYKFGGVHQHTPEIEETLTGLAKVPVKISFTPILAPMPRGILATVTSHTNKSEAELRKIYSIAYENETFVSLLQAEIGRAHV